MANQDHKVCFKTKELQFFFPSVSICYILLRTIMASWTLKEIFIYLFQAFKELKWNSFYFLLLPNKWHMVKGL